jgi:hypothetical protein
VAADAGFRWPRLVPDFLFHGLRKSGIGGPQYEIQQSGQMCFGKDSNGVKNGKSA